MGRETRLLKALYTVLLNGSKGPVGADKPMNSWKQWTVPAPVILVSYPFYVSSKDGSRGAENEPK